MAARMIVVLDANIREDRILRLIVIDKSRIEKNLVGNDVTILSEIEIEMAEIEQKFLKNLPTVAASTARKLKIEFLFMRLFKKSLILLTERVYRNDNKEYAQMNWLEKPFSDIANWVLNLTKLENHIPLVDLAILTKIGKNDYPLLEMELAATYSPQNWYCYVIDTNSDAQFKRQIHALSRCFPNILIGDERQMTSAGEGMTEAYLDCLTRLAEPSRKWKYVSLLQNHDTAIKTRTQIIQILRWMKGSNDAEIMNPGIRMNRDMNWTVSALSFFNNSTKMTELSSQNISLSKGSVAATLSRPMVEYVMRELNLTELLKRLNEVGFGRDELLFPTLNSADIIEAPGGASQICIEKGQQVEQMTRAVVWAQYAKECTSNYLRHSVCVLGMEDLAPNLLRALVCWYESLFNRRYFLINSAFRDILTMNLPTQSTSSDSSDRYKLLPHRTLKNLPQNHWNPNDCHQKLHLIRPDCLKILCLEKNGNDFGGCTVRAKSMLSLHCGLFYYEVKIHQGR
uniref:COR domain-containing protein n=1 Tax=Globodera pallida TaxID=36090 RepID=A0A183BYU6_GLOPA